MHPRPTGCRRAVQRLRPPADTIWISESILASAFERYCRVASSGRRNAGALPPGPLEARSRLGKRKMAALNVVAPSTVQLPAFAFETTPDRARWKWEAPTSPDIREKNKLQPKPWRLSTALDDWIVKLEQSSLARADRQTNQEGDSAAANTIDQRAKALECRINEATTEDFLLELDEFAEFLSKEIYLGRGSLPKLLSVLGCLNAVLEGHKHARGSFDTSILQIYETIAIGAPSTKAASAAEYPIDIWRSILQGLSQLHPSLDTIELFGHIVHTVPSNYVPELWEGICSIIRRTFAPESFDSTWPSVLGASRLEQVVARSQQLDQMLADVPIRRDVPLTSEGRLKLSQTTAEVADISAAINEQQQDLASLTEMLRRLDELPSAMANALSRLMLRDRPELLRQLLDALLPKVGPGQEVSVAMRRCVAMLLARLPFIEEATILDTTVQLFSPDPSHLSTRDVCAILIEHWISCGSLPGDFRPRYETHLKRAPDGAIAALAHAIYSIRIPADAKLSLTSALCGALQRLGHYDEIPESFAAYFKGIRRRELAAVQGVARASQDHRLAFDLHWQYTSNQERHNAKRNAAAEWKWSFWKKTGYAELIAKDPLLAPSCVWNVLGIPLYRGGSYNRVFSRPFRDVPSRKERLIDQVIGWVMERPDVSNRAALRFVWRGYLYLVQNRATPSPAMMLVLAKLVTRDLAKGKGHGSMERMDWIRRVILNHQGTEASVRFTDIIERWMRAQAKITA